jgi:hypothetical protein
VSTNSVLSNPENYSKQVQITAKNLLESIDI